MKHKATSLLLFIFLFIQGCSSTPENIERLKETRTYETAPGEIIIYGEINRKIIYKNLEIVTTVDTATQVVVLDVMGSNISHNQFLIQKGEKFIVSAYSIRLLDFYKEAGKWWVFLAINET